MNIAAVKIAQKQAKLSDEAYRNLLFDVAGVRSSKELDDKYYKKVLAAIYRTNQIVQTIQTFEKSPQEKKLWACWYNLAKYLPAEQRNAKYLMGFVCKILSNDKLKSTKAIKLLNKYELKKVIDSLNNRIEYEKEKLEQEVPF